MTSHIIITIVLSCFALGMLAFGWYILYGNYQSPPQEDGDLDLTFEGLQDRFWDRISELRLGWLMRPVVCALLAAVSAFFVIYSWITGDWFLLYHASHPNHASSLNHVLAPNHTTPPHHATFLDHLPSGYIKFDHGYDVGEHMWAYLVLGVILIVNLHGGVNRVIDRVLTGRRPRNDEFGAPAHFMFAAFSAIVLAINVLILGLWN